MKKILLLFLIVWSLSGRVLAKDIRVENNTCKKLGFMHSTLHHYAEPKRMNRYIPKKFRKDLSHANICENCGIMKVYFVISKERYGNNKLEHITVYDKYYADWAYNFHRKQNKEAKVWINGKAVSKETIKEALKEYFN